MIACIFMCSIWMVTRRYSPPFNYLHQTFYTLAVLSILWFSFSCSFTPSCLQEAGY